MAFDVDTDTAITGFNAADTQTLKNMLSTTYTNSTVFQGWVDDWIAAGNKIEIEFEAGAAFVRRKADGSVGDKVSFDLDFADGKFYISDTGTAVDATPLMVLIHELGHSLVKNKDRHNNDDAQRLPIIDLDDPDGSDFMGSNLEEVNKVYEQIGLPTDVSYVAHTTSTFVEEGVEYTNGSAITGAVVSNRALTSTGATDDLLIGGPGGNTLQSGKGTDFLVGAGGDDTLNGGEDTDTVVYLGKPTDYDVRNLDPDLKLWQVRHVRGDKDDGTDRVINAEAIQFEGGETFDLTKKGLTFQHDFALVIDTTGSMGDDIDGVKTRANAIIDSLFDGNTDARIGVVGYKDETLGDAPSIILPFTDHDDFADRKTAAINAINGITVSGGGDLPETYYGGLLAALDGRLGDWRPGAGALQIVGFTDAAAKDDHLFAQVAALAADIGVSITGSSSVTGAHSAIDTFELSFSGDAGFLPDDEDNPIAPSDPLDDTIEADDTTATLEIYSIFTGPTGVDTSELESIAEETGGAFLTATTPEDLVDTLIDIIEAPSEPSLVGTPDNDVLIGGPEDDTITGLAGHDRLVGNRGNDSIEGNRGNDILLGRAGDDELLGGQGNDVVRGGRGTDVVAGGLGNDRLYGGPRDDLLFGGPGRDVLRGGPGADQMRGGADDDELRGGFGDDLMFGGRGDDDLFGFLGDDELRGGPGNDELRGGGGQDLVAGGSGDDLLFGGPGSDRLFGGPGADAFIFSDNDDLGTGPDRDVVLDFEPGTDALNLSNIDADQSVEGDQAFSFIGAAAFSAAGELRYESGLLAGDTDGDGVADFEIAFANSALLTSDDMLL